MLPSPTWLELGLVTCEIHVHLATKPIWTVFAFVDSHLPDSFILSSNQALFSLADLTHRKPSRRIDLSATLDPRYQSPTSSNRDISQDHHTLSTHEKIPRSSPMDAHNFNVEELAAARRQAIDALEKAYNNGVDPDTQAINNIVLNWTATPRPSWYHTGSALKPSWALVAAKGNGEKIGLFNGMWMRAEDVKFQKRKYEMLSLEVPHKSGTPKREKAGEFGCEELGVGVPSKKHGPEDEAPKEAENVNEEAPAKKHAVDKSNTGPPEAPSTALAPVKKKIDLFELPYEVRTNIYGYLVGAPRLPAFLRFRYGMSPKQIDIEPLAQAGNRALRQEVLNTTLQTATIELHSGEGNRKFQQWLGSLSFDAQKDDRVNHGLDAVHSLRFPFFSRFPHRHLEASVTNSNIDLMRMCSNLKKVEVQFVSQELYQNAPATWPVVEKTIDELRAAYRLDAMRNLPCLEKLVLIGPGPGYFGHAAMLAMATFFRWVYAVQGKVLKVVHA
jgi:hypothetical protein